ncbi:MAG: hypothetical protein ACK5KU_10885 [Beutenbergiaceae bacterium]
MITAIRQWWARFEKKRPNTAQFIMFFILSNGVTLLQVALMPILKGIFNQTSLVNVSAQWFPVGSKPGGDTYYIFDYPPGELGADGTGGGLAYFLAVQIAILVAQVINFFAQRNVTFKATNSVGKAAFWYVIAYIVITFGAAAAQGFYKAPIYSLLQGWWGDTGVVVADVVTMIINAAISFWVFFPIFKLIFKSEPEEEAEVAEEGADAATDVADEASDTAAKK